MKFHPAAQILTWCLLVAIMQVLALGALLMAAGLILLAAFVISRHKFIQLLRRTRWIMLSLLLIYAYSTPGQALSDALGMFSPSREGLADGVLQLERQKTENEEGGPGRKTSRAKRQGSGQVAGGAEP